MSQKVQKQPWYKEGLSFNCTGCGKCCEGSPGYIWVTREEIKKIAESLNLPISDFVKQYVRQIGNKYSLKELPKDNYKCIFLKNKQCQIYEVRPLQCRTYPFWPQVLKSSEHWEQESKSCEGMQESEDKLSFEEIQKRSGF